MLHFIKSMFKRYSWLLEYIKNIFMLSRLELYLYPTISVGEASCPPSHVPPIYSTPRLSLIQSINYTNLIILHGITRLGFEILG